MKIFGYEAEVKPHQTEVTREEICDLLDAMHDSLTADENLYSADLVSDGTDSITVLLGVQVDDSANWTDAKDLGSLALTAAFNAAEVDAVHVLKPHVTNVRQMAFAN